MITIIDTDVDVSAKLPQLKAQGVVSIGRYLNRRNPAGAKVIKPAEARAFAANEMRLFLIYEFDGHPNNSITGTLDGEWTMDYVKTIGAPLDGTAFIAYTVDYDAPESDMPGIKAAFTAFRAAITPAFMVGSYASGAVNAELYAANLIDVRWLTCSRGFRGTQQALANGDYEMRQSVPGELIGLDIDPNTAHYANDTVGFIPFATVSA
jgi:hypothetical protein